MRGSRRVGSPRPLSGEAFSSHDGVNLTIERYDAHATEAKWQRVWDDAGAALVADPEPGEERAGSGKSYVVEMWPYPSGSLHMGHCLVYTIGDVLTRFRRRNGEQVLHPIGFD